MAEVSLFPGALDDTNIYEAVARLSTTLTADITAATTTIPLASTTGFPTKGYIVIDNETIAYISVSVGSVDATGGRGHAGTAASHTSTTQVLVAVTATAFNKLRAGLIAIQTALKVNLTSTVLTTPSLISPIISGNVDAWIEKLGTTWTYVSPIIVNVPAGLGYTFQKGDKIRLKQGGAYKYFSVYLVDIANSALYVIGGTDFTLASAAITDMAYSHQENPLDFPGYFNWTPTVTYGGGTTNPTSNTIDLAKFRVVGNECRFIIGSTLVKGAGDRSTIMYSNPIARATANTIPLNAYSSCAGGNAMPVCVMEDSNKFEIFQTMSSNGVYSINSSYDI